MTMFDSVTDSVSLWSALVVQGPLERVVIPLFVHETAVTVDPLFDPTTVLLERLASGERPDVLVSTTGSFATLGEDIVAAASITPLIRTGLGVGYAAGTAAPAVGTLDEFIDTIRSARSVAYSRAGQSGIYFASLIERLGFAEEINAKATIIEKGFTGFAVLDGRADVAIQQVSELRFVPGISVAGRFPDEAQLYTDFSVALGAGAAQSESATALHRFLTSREALDSFVAEGLLLPLASA
jgi:molybdate transport system substrate-binding protein